MRQQAKPTTLTFPGRYHSLSAISKFVSKAAKDANLDSDSVYAIVLAVDEACSNIIEHAYGGEDLGAIECSCVPIHHGLKVILQDHGIEFDPTRIPEKKFDVPLEELSPGGAGWFLIQQMMDEVIFERTTEGGNRLILIKILHQDECG